jgi:stage III sporulation protein AA
VARAFEGIGKLAPKSGSLLILGPPGSGKTTLLRDLIRVRSEAGQAVSVVDERGELFPIGADFPGGLRTDIITGCSKRIGVNMVIKTMRPRCVAVDEITAQEDVQALLDAGWCGVELLATAHAEDARDLLQRRIYRPLVESGLFQQVLVLQADKSWRLERVGSCH